MGKKRSIKKKTQKVGEQVVKLFDMPQEVLLDLPIITCVGRGLLTIENHRGIIEYTESIIRINVSVGELKITGKGLQVKNILSEGLEIEGTINNISFN